jgi:ribonuclease BN (tRNA processing enzyme)
MDMRVIPLGTNGFMPTFGRQTMCFLVLTHTDAILLDAGTGLARLLEPSIEPLLAPYDCLNIFLSHYHLDHIVGLSYLPGLTTFKSIKIYAPDVPFVDVSPDKALQGLLGPPFLSLSLSDFPSPVDIIPISRENMLLGAAPVCMRRQKHPGGSVGIRIKDSVAYVTDTIVDDETVTLALDTQFLIHEVWMTDAEAENNEAPLSGHSYLSGVARIAKLANVGRLMVAHHHPKRTPDEIDEIASRIAELSGKEVIVPVEGQAYDEN